MLHLESDISRFLSLLVYQIVIGCDGVRSPVAKWMGFPEPRYVGHCAFRGLAVYPEGHSHNAKVNYIYGRGIRAGFLAISPTKVYWFICWNSASPGLLLKHYLTLLGSFWCSSLKLFCMINYFWSYTIRLCRFCSICLSIVRDSTVLNYQAINFTSIWMIHSHTTGPKIKDPSVLKQEALGLVRSWPEELLDVIQSTSEDVVIKTPLVDRWLWPILTPPASSNGVVVVGDAWHPMTPNLGQGACCALEDSVVLVKKLASAITSGRRSVVDKALLDYSRERWARIFPLTVRSNIVGSLLQWDDPLVCAFRNNVMVPRLVNLGPFLEHTNFECEMLEPATTSGWFISTSSLIIAVTDHHFVLLVDQ